MMTSLKPVDRVDRALALDAIHDYYAARAKFDRAETVADRELAHFELNSLAMTIEILFSIAPAAFIGGEEALVSIIRRDGNPGSHNRDAPVDEDGSGNICLEEISIPWENPNRYIELLEEIIGPAKFDCAPGNIEAQRHDPPNVENEMISPRQGQSL